MKSLKKRAEDFWKTFSERDSEIRNLMDENKIMERFSDIDSMFEIDMPFMMGKSSDGKYELIFNPAGLKSRYFIADYFKRAFFNDKKNEFESALDYTIEIAFREGIEKAMTELNFKELIAEKAKELLKSDNLIQELAEAKVRSSLGLPQK